jgi:large subunit ribosomal protein L2
MGIRFKPYTASTRNRSVSDFSEITQSSPEKSLTAPLQCSKDEITEGLLLVDIVVGTKKFYRIIDLKRQKLVFQVKSLLLNMTQP